MPLAATRSRGQFFETLRQSGHNGKAPVIAEIKVHTPKNGALLRERTVESIADLYELSGMACLSVVTGHWFKGSPQLLRQVSKVTSLPILRKDFIVTRSGLQLSQELGASAVLLTKQLIDDSTLIKLTDCALSMGLTPFIEVGSADEIATIRLDQDAILAVCNRDIKTRETDDGDISKSLALLAAAKSTGAGLIVSASAIENSGQAKQLIDSGYDALLIGTAFLQAPDLTGILNEFSGVLKKTTGNFYTGCK
jgi:indole-3-glycerol phosphate synthase